MALCSRCSLQLGWAQRNGEVLAELSMVPLVVLGCVGQSGPLYSLRCRYTVLRALRHVCLLWNCACCPLHTCAP
jgi:hypothetical protein